MSWRLLVIANETLVSRDVRDLVSARSAGRAARVLALFPADEVPIATHPPRASCRLERDVVDRARARVAAPVHHVVVEREPVAA